MLVSVFGTRKKLLLVVIIGAFVLSLGYLVSTLVGLANQQIAERHLKALDYGRKRIESRIVNIEAVLATVRYDPRGTVSAEESARDVRHLLRDYPEVQDIWIASPEKRIVYASNNAYLGRDLTDAACFNGAKSAQKSVFTDCDFGQSSEAPHITIAVPLFNGQEFRGVVGASIDLRRFDEMLQDIVRDENNMVLTIVSGNMTVMASSSSDVVPKKPLTGSLPVSEILQGREGYTKERSPVFNDERFYAYSPLLDGQCYIILSQPLTDVYRPWLLMLRNGIPLLLLTILLLVGLIHQIITLEEMRKAEALDFQAEKSHAVAELAASIAHEIRNPITAIRGFMQLLAQRGTDDKAHEYAQLIVAEVDNVEAIIGEFLDLAKPHIIKKEKFNLSHVLHSVYMLAQGRAVYSGVYVAFDVAEECMVLGDEVQLKQAFLNLCTNAIQAMPAGGRLTIFAACAHGKIIVKITDTGEGIPPQHVKRLGERFFTTKATGSGIGLAVTYRIIKQHHGAINVTSAVGKGTKFTIELPAWIEARA